MTTRIFTISVNYDETNPVEANKIEHLLPDFEELVAREGFELDNSEEEDI